MAMTCFWSIFPPETGFLLWSIATAVTGLHKIYGNSGLARHGAGVTAFVSHQITGSRRKCAPVGSLPAWLQASEHRVPGGRDEAIALAILLDVAVAREGGVEGLHQQLVSQQHVEHLYA